MPPDLLPGNHSFYFLGGFRLSLKTISGFGKLSLVQQPTDCSRADYKNTFYCFNIWRPSQIPLFPFHPSSQQWEVSDALCFFMCILTNVHWWFSPVFTNTFHSLFKTCYIHNLCNSSWSLFPKLKSTCL